MDTIAVVSIMMGLNTFINGVWLILYNSQNKRIDTVESKLDKLLNKE